MIRRLHSLAANAALGLLVAAVLTNPAPTSADSRLEDYRELARCAFSRPVSLPAGGVEIRLDAARWQLQEGSFRIQSPLSDDRSYGLVFEGRGQFVLEIPDPVELRQLRRFTKQPDLELFEQELTTLVITTSDPGIFANLSADGPFEPLGVARDRHLIWLRRELMDSDSHLIEALSDPGAAFTRVDFKTRDWGWLSVTFREREREELELTRFHPGYKATESWVSLDRAEDRRPNGRPSYDYRAAFTVPHVDVVVDVRERAKQGPKGFSAVQPIRAKFRSRVQVVSQTQGLGVLRLSLSPLAELKSVVDADGNSLETLRDRIGKRWASMDKDIQDDSLLVLLPEELSEGESTRLTIEYEMRLDGYAPGRSWYPGPEGPIPVALSPHTTTIEILHRENQAVRASGVLKAEEGGWALWAHERPVKMTSFAALGKPFETSHHLDQVPDVRTFTSLGGSMTSERVEQVGSDVSLALDYFQKVFDDRLEVPEVRTVMIPSFHGQAFDGFLHIGDFTVMFDSLAATTLFRAHEVAHQWWGHRVLWASYRDQWLSEAFAEYSAMMFVHDAVEGGPKEFHKILEAYSDEVTGSIKSAFSNYARPDYTPMTRIGLDRIGPIGHGYRCHVAEAPSSYFTQTYLKGSLVLHMLRTLVTHMTRDPDVFIDILRTFVDRHAGGFASTEDFIAVVTEKVPADWSWFFDQWVYGAEIPTYQWSYKIAKGSQKPFELRLHVEQSNVSEGFRMAVPVRIEFSGDRVATVLAFVNAPSRDFTFPLPERPKKVLFNPDNAVLARMKKR